MCELGIFPGGSYGFLSTVSSTGHNRSLPIRNRETSSVPGMPCSDGGHYLFLILCRFLGAAVSGGWFQCRHSCSPAPTPHPYLSVRSFSALMFEEICGCINYVFSPLTFSPPHVTRCCQRHRKLGDVESPFSKHNPMDSAPQKEKE